MDKSRFVQITRQSKVSEEEFYQMTASMYKETWENLLPPQITTHGLSDKVAENVITPPDAPIPDCVTCGGCCLTFTQAAVYPHDNPPPESYWEITVQGEKGEITVDKFLRRNGETFACNSLGGKIGEKVGCTIYEARPQVCRNFEAGSDKCHAIRRAFGFEPNLELMEMFFAVQKLKALPEKDKIASQEIDEATFVEQPETGFLEIKLSFADDSTQIIHTFDPAKETWHQFEFKGLSLEAAKNLIEARAQETKRINSLTRLVELTRNQQIEEEEFQTMMNRMYEQIWNNLLPPQILTDDLTIKAASNLITPVGTPIPDCETCGACCIALPCVGVLPNDKELSPGEYWDVTVKGSSGDIVVDRFLRRNAETFACSNLDGTPGEKVSCRIYEQRPHTCHSFEAGSDKCHALRRAYGFEPFLSLMEMFYAQQKLKNRPENFQPSEVISYVNIVEQPETGDLAIKATLKDRSTQIIHTYNPNRETWRQFEFEGLPLEFVKEFVESRKRTKTE